MFFNFADNEKNILRFWEEKRIFEKLRQKISGRPRWSFLDGPITANNPMGIHHAWGRTYKDIFQRYKAMKGFDQRFHNGFDCQGLWVEVEVEKELGFKTKKEIENFGIDKFVDKCKSRVMKYSKIQTEQSIRLGQWMDWENSYFTMSDENNYAIWYFLRKCHQKNLLYKGNDVVPWCPRCGTAISQHEILTEEYKEIVHRAVYLKIPLKKEKAFFLVWTTTPWTLPGNVALAVNPDFEYAKVRTKGGEIYFLLKERMKDILEEKEIERWETIRGEKMIGWEYEGIFDDLPAVKKSLGDYQHKVVGWKEVTLSEGTGIVHLAPACGEEDFALSKEFGLPLVDLSDDESNYREGFGELAGHFVGSEEAKEIIFRELEKRKVFFKEEDYTHRYPVCWRCKTELIFRLVDEWYIAMDPLRNDLMKIVHKIKWIPSFGLERELDWLRNMKDWLISKKRYWGLALPIFECSCGNFEVIGSKEELKERAVEGWSDFEGKSPHRPWIDKVKIKCSRCGKLVSRIPEVGSPWLDAGIVPFSTLNEGNASSMNKPELKETMPSYFRDKKYWKKWFPADFICESFPGQFKNWFYAILVMSYVLEKKPPFKTILGFASVVDEKGEEMHKSKGNVIWFDEAIEKIGADLIRWMYAKQNPAVNMKFGYEGAKKTERILLTLVNCFVFFKTYAQGIPFSSPERKGLLSQFFSLFKKQKGVKPQNILDKWIISRLNALVEETTAHLEQFETAKAVLAIEDFFTNDLSLWYIRRSRKRFQQPASEEQETLDKKKQQLMREARQTLYEVLLTLLKLIAPIMPFFAEKMYQELKDEGMALSIHLNDWPKSMPGRRDRKLEEQMTWAREIVAKSLAKRTELKVKVRQPLKKLTIKKAFLTIPTGGKTLFGKVICRKSKISEELLELIKEEVNVKEIVFDEKIEEEIKWDTEITEELREEGCLREFIRHLQEMRKNKGLTPREKIGIYYTTVPLDSPFNQIILKNKEIILKETRSVWIENGLPKEVIPEGEITIEKSKVAFVIRVIN